jgi:hypothetical protein
MTIVNIDKCRLHPANASFGSDFVIRCARTGDGRWVPVVQILSDGTWHVVTESEVTDPSRSDNLRSAISMTATRRLKLAAKSETATWDNASFDELVADLEAQHVPR